MTINYFGFFRLIWNKLVLIPLLLLIDGATPTAPSLTNSNGTQISTLHIPLPTDSSGAPPPDGTPTNFNVLPTSTFPRTGSYATPRSTTPNDMNANPEVTSSRNLNDEIAPRDLWLSLNITRYSLKMEGWHPYLLDCEKYTYIENGKVTHTVFRNESGIPWIFANTVDDLFNQIEQIDGSSDVVYAEYAESTGVPVYIEFSDDRYGHYDLRIYFNNTAPYYNEIEQAYKLWRDNWHFDSYTYEYVFALTESAQTIEKDHRVVSVLDGKVERVDTIKEGKYRHWEYIATEEWEYMAFEQFFDYAKSSLMYIPTITYDDKLGYPNSISFSYDNPFTSGKSAPTYVSVTLNVFSINNATLSPRLPTDTPTQQPLWDKIAPRDLWLSLNITRYSLKMEGCPSQHYFNGGKYTYIENGKVTHTVFLNEYGDHWISASTVDDLFNQIEQIDGPSYVEYAESTGVPTYISCCDNGGGPYELSISFNNTAPYYNEIEQAYKLWRDNWHFDSYTYEYESTSTLTSYEDHRVVSVLDGKVERVDTIKYGQFWWYTETEEWKYMAFEQFFDYAKSSLTYIPTITYDDKLGYPNSISFSYENPFTSSYQSVGQRTPTYVTVTLNVLSINNATTSPLTNSESPTDTPSQQPTTDAPTASNTNAQKELTSARNLWISNNINRYAIFVQDRQQELYVDGMTAQSLYIRVENDAVVSTIPTRRLSSEGDINEQYTINDLFDIIQDAIDTNTVVNILYDTQYGYPTLITIEFSNLIQTRIDISIIHFQNIELWQTQYNNAYELWMNSIVNIPSYTYEYYLECPEVGKDGCSDEFELVEIVNDESSIGNGIDGLFNSISQVLDPSYRDAFGLYVGYNETYGYPSILSLERHISVGNLDQLVVSVKNVTLQTRRPKCGDNICQAGENCENCSQDCRQRTVGNPVTHYCCYGGPSTDIPNFIDFDTYDDLAVSCEYEKCQRKYRQCDTNVAPKFVPECQIDNDCPNNDNNNNNDDACMKNICIDGECKQINIIPSTAVCGDGICSAGENCENCPQDCRKRIHGAHDKQICCYGGSSIPLFKESLMYDSIAISCEDSRCEIGERSCDITDSSIATTTSTTTTNNNDNNNNDPNSCGPEECIIDKDCDDKNICTDDICRNGVCINPLMTIKVGWCGDDICQHGENCENCPQDCRGRTRGKRGTHFCCYGGPSSSDDNVPEFVASDIYDPIAVSCDYYKCNRKSNHCDMNRLPNIPSICLE